jgi:hypothetical protein
VHGHGVELRGGCTCQPTGYVYQRNIKHTNVWVDISTNTGLNGSYSIGTVSGVGGDQNVLLEKVTFV